MTIFTRLPVVAAASGLSQISVADVNYFVDYEPDSYDHWIFNNGASSLTGMKAGKVLTAQTAPTYSAKYLNMNTVNGHALLTDLGEVAAQADTVCCVFRPIQTTGLQVPFGTLGASNGGSPFISGTEPSRTVFETYRGINNSLNLTFPVTHGNWYFLAVARDYSGATKYMKHILGGQAVDERTVSGTYGPTSGGNFIACGNPYFSSVATGSMDFAEFMVFPRMLSAAELSALYTRRKAKLASLCGITVV